MNKQVGQDVACGNKKLEKVAGYRDEQITMQREQGMFLIKQGDKQNSACRNIQTSNSNVQEKKNRWICRTLVLEVSRRTRSFFQNKPMDKMLLVEMQMDKYMQVFVDTCINRQRVAGRNKETYTE